MDYLQQISWFYNRLSECKLTSSQIALWHSLAYISHTNNYCGWFNVFTSELEQLTGLSPKTIRSARELLQNNRLIEYESNNTTASRYKLLIEGKYPLVNTDIDPTKGKSILVNEDAKSTKGKCTLTQTEPEQIKVQIPQAGNTQESEKITEIDKQVFAFLGIPKF